MQSPPPPSWFLIQTWAVMFSGTSLAFLHMSFLKSAAGAESARQVQNIT